MSASLHSVAPFTVEEGRHGFLIIDYLGDSIGALALETGDHPYEEQRANAYLFMVSPKLLRALKLAHAIRPENWDDSEDPDQVLAWMAVEDAIALAEPSPSVIAGEQS